MAQQKKTIKGANSNHHNYMEEKEYEHAISLLQYATQLLWQQFGTFMLAETVIISFLGNALIENKKLIIGENLFVFFGAFIGLIICILWYSTFEYNHTMYRLRMAQARRHEKVLRFTLLTEGKKLYDRKRVEIGGDDFSYPLLVRLLRPYFALLILIILFGIIFILLMVVSCPC